VRTRRLARGDDQAQSRRAGPKGNYVAPAWPDSYGSNSLSAAGLANFLGMPWTPGSELVFMFGGFGENIMNPGPGLVGGELRRHPRRASRLREVGSPSSVGGRYGFSAYKDSAIKVARRADLVRVRVGPIS
jgi:hypothetical protein